MGSTAMQGLQNVLEQFQSKDIEGVVAQFAPDGVFADPHYPPPIGPRMAGRAAIREGVAWGLGMLEQPHFVVRHALVGLDSDRVAAAEVDTNHVMQGGAVLTFTQLFVVEVDDEGLVVRMESYTSYPPPPPT